MKSQGKVLLTGASGFLGTALFESLSIKYRVVPMGRRVLASVNEDDQCVVDFSCYDAVRGEFPSGVTTVIHSAARVHVMNEKSSDAIQLYRQINVDFSLALAKRAHLAGVKRFIFISSVKVSGESTSGQAPFSESDKCRPEDAYGISKLEAEIALRDFSKQSGLEVVIIRPPLIYGPGVKANFNSLIKLAKLPFPLPFGAVKNYRSMVYLGNLVDLIIRCINHPSAANETFLVSDDNDVSLRSLLTMMRSAMGRSSRLVPVPLGLFKLAGALTGKRGVVDRLVGDLQVDSSKARSLLGWVPPYTVEQGTVATVADFMSKEQ